MFLNKFISAVCLTLLAGLADADATHPNIVLIIGDDISCDFGCFGGDALTPNIDQLAAGGVRFDNAYVTASSCSPSRCSIITGRYPHNTGAPELHMGLPAGQFMFPKALREGGYYCAQAGKWHLGDVAKEAFDQVGSGSDKKLISGAEGWVQALQERPKDKPFFMWFASFDAHRPWQDESFSLRPDPATVSLFAGIPDTPAAREDVASYLHEIQRLDRYVGAVVKELKHQGVFEDTLILLLGDNGRPFPRNKTSLYDNGMKTPLVVHWPGGDLKEGAQCASLVSSIDIAPAILEAAGLAVPPQVQGVSLLPVCRQPEQQIRKFVFGERNWHVQRACGRLVRQGDFVYIRDFTPGCYSFQMVNNKDATYSELLRLKKEGNLTPSQAEAFSTDREEEMLFKLSDDPQQVRNLVGNAEYKTVLERLRKTLRVWQEQTGDAVPAVEEMTVDRQDRQTFERLYKEGRPPTGILPGQVADAEHVHAPGPF